MTTKEKTKDVLNGKSRIEISERRYLYYVFIDLIMISLFFIECFKELNN